MATVNFTYDYPYAGYGEDGRFQAQWSESRKTLNGCYTYPMVFNTAVPQCKHIKMNVEIENTGSGTVLGRSWDFFVYRQSYGWYEVCSFTLPDDGKYTIDRDMPGYTITQIACVPSSNPGSSRTWNTWYGIEQLTITETVTVNELTTGTFQYGVFANYYGLEQKLTEVYANIDGALKQATDVLVNIDGSLISLPQVQSAYLKTTSDAMTLYGFTPSVSGSYRITQKKISGDHEIRLYGSDFTPLYDGYFYDRSFDLVAGTLYYITVTHYRGAGTSESYLQIFKEA